MPIIPTAEYSQAVNTKKLNFSHKNISSLSRSREHLSTTSSKNDRIRIRLLQIKEDDWYKDEEISNEVFKNVNEVSFDLLKSFMDRIDPEEIGPSGNGTIILNFEHDDQSLILEIGETTVAHVFTNDKNKMSLGSSHFNDKSYWENVKNLLEIVYMS